MKERPNIVNIFVESMCYSDIAALGNDEIITPNLDRLMARGTTMFETHNMGSFSKAVCVPSRGMIYSGRNLFSLPGNGGDVPKEDALIGEYLWDQGYDTYHTGKWHISRDNYRRSFGGGAAIHGFTKGLWYANCNGHWHDPIHDFDPTGEYPPEKGYVAGAPIEPFEQPFTITEPSPDCVHSAELFTDKALDFLRSRKVNDKPFFLDIPHITVHDPLQVPRRFLELYRDTPLSLYPNYAPEHPFDNGDLHVRDEVLMPYPRTKTAVVRRKLELYAMITHLDEQVGRIMDTLDELGLTENTILIFTSDHGCAHGQHGLVGKQNLHDHSVRVPLIMGGPGIKAGKVNYGLCYLTDLFPTLCELVELPIPESVQGKSFADNLCDGKASARDWLYLAYLGCQRAVREGDYKLIEYVVRGKCHRQLFNIAEDRWETTNLADSPEHTEVLNRFIQRLEEARGLFDDSHTKHGEQYWESRPQATPGKADPLPFTDVQPQHKALWRLVEANQHDVCIQPE